MMVESLRLQPRNLSDSRAEIDIVGVPRPIDGELYGPACAYARTLATDYPIVVASPSSGGEPPVSVIVVDPCYWTPALPFLYELVLRFGEPAGTMREVRRKIGLRRLFPKGRAARRRSGREAFELESKRFVLRGVCSSIKHTQLLDDARRSEAAMLLSCPNEKTCATASEKGVFLIADLRNASDAIGPQLAELAWQPAVAAVILNSREINVLAGDLHRQGLWVAQAIGAATGRSSAEVSERADALLVELEPGERPPAWMASCDRPVIAVRRGSAYADLLAARAACDRLQADLAPEFDLAGYFVGP